MKYASSHPKAYTTTLVTLLVAFHIAIDTTAQPITPFHIATLEHSGTTLRAEIRDGDTLPIITLPQVWVYPPITFKNKREEKFYWRLVRDVKRTLPVAKEIRQIIIATNDTLMKIPTKRERDKYMRGFEKRLYSSNYDRLSRFTFRQGTLLIRLVDRECDATGYDLIKAYRGSFTAGFYQFFAKMFGASLKTPFGEHEDDPTIERIINLVESGQL